MTLLVRTSWWKTLPIGNGYIIIIVLYVVMAMCCHAPNPNHSIATMGLDEADYDDGLDPEIELEMEAFIDEIEEHLMLQDFDPDLQKND